MVGSSCQREREIERDGQSEREKERARKWAELYDRQLKEAKVEEKMKEGRG